MKTQTPRASDFELRFQPLGDAGRAYAFPCDAAGRVDLDALGARALNEYLFARAVIGRDFLMPTVHLCAS